MKEKICTVTWEEVEQAAKDACKNHMRKETVLDFCRHWEENVSIVLSMIRDGTYVELVRYRKLVKKNKNGKVRDIDSPNLITRILQYVFINRISPLYEAKDDLTALNCKKGCGLNAADKRKSVRHRVKHLFYDRRDIHYIVCIDQRKCYQHIKTSVMRKAVKRLTNDGWLVDFGMEVTMVDGSLPIGTPVSPLAHHIIMLDFDLRMADDYPF